jgi:3-phosphoshikimate 1-carboxyvinyltransferase
MSPALPPILEIPSGRVARGSVRVPGSKSLTQRALVVAALAEGRSILAGALDSDDSRALRAALRRLGARIRAHGGRWIVEGTGGRLRPVRAPLRVGNAGTAMRFLTALAPLGRGRYLIDGDARMRRRPIGDLVTALRRLGVEACCPRRRGFPPVEIRAAGGLPGGETRLAGSTSSQYLSALLMAAPLARHHLRIRVAGRLVSAPYVGLTLAVMRAFGAHVRVAGAGAERGRGALGGRRAADARRPLCFMIPGGQRYRTRRYAIEGDASSASYFLAAAAITGGRVRVANLGGESAQGDARFADLLERMGCRTRWGRGWVEVSGPPLDGAAARRGFGYWRGSPALHGIDADMSDMPDVVPTLAVTALFASSPTRIRGAAHLRFKESDRLGALAREIASLGGNCRETSDGLIIRPGPLRGATIRTYDDHRMAMALALVGLRVPGVRIADPSCVRKSFPDYFARLFSLLRAGRRADRRW